MDIFLLYCLFAVTTGLVSLYEILAPVLRKRNVESEKNNAKLKYYIVALFVHTLFAPLVFLSCIIPEWSLRFQEALYKGLFLEQDV